VSGAAHGGARDVVADKWPRCLKAVTTFIAIAAGSLHGVALGADGRLVGWGNNVWGQTDVPKGTFIAIAAGYHHGLALRGPRPNPQQAGVRVGVNH